jgi:hypothetical protein
MATTAITQSSVFLTGSPASRHVRNTRAARSYVSKPPTRSIGKPSIRRRIATYSRIERAPASSSITTGSVRAISARRWRRRRSARWLALPVRRISSTQTDVSTKITDRDPHPGRELPLPRSRVLPRPSCPPTCPRARGRPSMGSVGISSSSSWVRTARSAKSIAARLLFRPKHWITSPMRSSSMTTFVLAAHLDVSPASTQ